MTQLSKAPGKTALLGLAFALFAGACGGDGNAGTGPADLTGSVVISGSSTVEPISGAVAEKFVAVNPSVELSVEGPGTSDGFEMFCNGETDISDASRPIDPEEAEACQENGIEFIEAKVAIDGITVLTHPSNDIACLTFRDLYALLGPESEGFENWSDANQLAADVGAEHAPYPDTPLDITAPGEESGTYDSFAELVLEDIAFEDRGIKEDAPVVRPDYQASGNDNVIVQGIQGSESSLGWVGFAFYVQNESSVRAIPVAEEGTDCVEPTIETIQSGGYPIARDLFFYVNKAHAEENEALRAFVDFYLSDEGLASVSEVGYVEQTTEAIEASRSAWEALEAGTREQS